MSRTKKEKGGKVEEEYENFDEGMDKELSEDSLDGIMGDDGDGFIPEEIFKFQKSLDSFNDGHEFI